MVTWPARSVHFCLGVSPKRHDAVVSEIEKVVADLFSASIVLASPPSFRGSYARNLR
jgi:hypothetical protein